MSTVDSLKCPNCGSDKAAKGFNSSKPYLTDGRIYCYDCKKISGLNKLKPFNEDEYNKFVTQNLDSEDPGME